MSKIIYLKDYIKDSSIDSEFVEDHWEETVDLSLEQHSHDLRSLTDWCADLNYRDRQLAIIIEDIDRDVQELRRVINKLLRSLNNS